MHGLFDDVAIIAYNDSASVMSGAFYLSPLDLLQPNAPVLGSFDGYGHGTPGAMPSLFIHPASAGGAECTP